MAPGLSPSRGPCSLYPSEYPKQNNQFHLNSRVCVVFGKVLLGWSALGSITLAQSAPPSPSLVHGSIISAQGQPVGGASIEIRDLRGVRIGTTVTNSTGDFEIKTAAASGEYVLLAAKEPILAQERISVGGPKPDVRITLPGYETRPPSPKDYTVSVGRLGTSDKARKHIQSAQVFFAKSDFAAAKKELDLALESDSECAQALTMRAHLKLATADPAGALDDATRAAAFDPDDAQSYIAMATAYNSLSQFQNAAQSAAQALMFDLDLWQARLELAKALYGEGMYVLALHEMDLLTMDFPDVHLVRGNVLMRLGRRQEGSTEFCAFLKLVPNDPRSLQIREIVSRTSVSR